MGQAKRRSKKKSEFKLPDLSLNKANLDVYKEKLQARLAPLKARWQALPKLHRRALAVLVPVVAVLLLLPVSEAPEPVSSGEPQRREISLNLGENEPTKIPVGERAEPLSPKRPIARTEPVSPEPLPVSSASRESVELQWQQYQVKQGETLANIFRDKSLPLSDLYAVAAIEGKDKPLSRIKAGQWLRYKQTADGSLDALQIESRSGDPVLFFRRSDGSFARGK